MMGRKAKLKQQKKLKSPQTEKLVEDNGNQFVEQLRKHGYKLQQIERSPQLPTKKTEPEV